MTLATPSPVVTAPGRQPLSSTIRRGRPDDAAALSRFATRTFVETYAAHHDPATLHRHALVAFAEASQAEALADPHVTVLLAFCGEALSGFVQLRIGVPPPGVTRTPCIELHRLYVDSPWHGRGVGRALLDQACAAASATGALALWLNVFERNARAIAFYRKSGFVDVGSAEFLVCDDRLTDRVMVAPLPLPR